MTSTAFLSLTTVSNLVGILNRPADMEKSHEWYLDGPNDWLIYSPSSVTVSYETYVRIEDSQEKFVKEDFYAEWVRICLPDGAYPGPPTTKPPTTTTTTTTTTTDYTGPSTTVDPSDCSRTRGENPRNPRDSEPNSDLSYRTVLSKSLLFYDAQVCFEFYIRLSHFFWC